MMTAAEAFGRFLRTLRHRCDLSLGDVAQITSRQPVSLDKGTLSRFERGRQRIPLEALIPLSRVYACSTEVLVERLELDTELEFLGGPQIRGDNYQELRRAGRAALLHDDLKWPAYAYFREAELRAGSSRDPQDRFTAQLNLATIVRALGKNRLALHELLDLDARGALDGGLSATLKERIGNCYRCMGDFERAERYLDQAVTQAHFWRDPRALAFANFSQGALELDRGETARGIERLARAFRTHRESADGKSAVAAHPLFETCTLLKVSDAFIRTGAYSKAGRAALAAKRFAANAGARAPLAYSELALGEIDDLTGRKDRALHRWRQADSLGREANNRRVRFIAEFYTFRQALSAGNQRLAHGSVKRLSRLVAWVPRHIPLIDEFFDLAHSKDLEGALLHPDGESVDDGEKIV